MLFGRKKDTAAMLFGRKNDSVAVRIPQWHQLRSR